MTPSARLWGERNLIINTPIMAWFADMFTPAMSTRSAARPEVSPLYADLAGMPPALFTVGTLDPLLDDSLFMASRWRAAGNDADAPGVPRVGPRVHPVPDGHDGHRLRRHLVVHPPRIVGPLTAHP